MSQIICKLLKSRIKLIYICIILSAISYLDILHLFHNAFTVHEALEYFDIEPNNNLV